MQKAKKINVVLVLLITVVLFFTSVENVNASGYGIDITFTGENKKTTSLNFEQHGKITCTSGVMTFAFKKGTEYIRRRVEFDANGWVRYEVDSDGNKLAVNSRGKDSSYDFQELLKRAKGGSLIVRFYKGTFNMHGPYRIYGNTTLRSPTKKAILKKTKNRYMFINVDDAAAKKVTTAYGGSGNIKLEGITFDSSNMNQEIGKFSRAKDLTIDNCTFMNGTPGHVFELTSIDKAVIENCTFKDLAYGATKENTTSFGKEIIQIESHGSPKASPYCYVDNFSNSYRSNNITIKNNSFNNILRGIGNHSGSYKDGRYCTDVKITGNSFDNVKEFCINLIGYDKVSISGNIFEYKIGEWISQSGDINIVEDTNGTINVGSNISKIKPPIE